MFKRHKPDEPTATPAETPQPGGPTPEAQPSGAQILPPFRRAAEIPLSSAQGKDSPAMARPPFTMTPATPQPAAPQPTPLNPGNRPIPAMPPRVAASDKRTLVVGRGISLQGSVQDAERLVVEGTVEAPTLHANELEIAQGGVFKGEVEVEDAIIAGTIDGTLTTRGSLIVRATGRVLGTARCRRLQVEDGGQITGRIEMIGESTPTAVPGPAASPPGASAPDPQSAPSPLSFGAPPATPA